MSLTQNITINQSQSLVMTPQLQLSIKLLQMSNMELSDFIGTEITKNPLLEEKPTKDNNESLDADHHREDFDEDNVYLTSNIGNGTIHRDDHSPNLEQYVAEEISLRDHIIEQIQIDFKQQKNQMIAVHLIDYLDGNGYLSNDATEIANQLGCKEDEINYIVGKMQKFDPPGLFAKNMSECLALQLKDRNQWNPEIEMIVNNLNMVADGQLRKLCQMAHISESRLFDYVRLIKTLQPRPALLFKDHTEQIINPDVFLSKTSDGEWKVDLNYDVLPGVLVNGDFIAEIESKKLKGDEKQFFKQKKGDANWLLKALQQRATTILRVSKVIVERQMGFFEQGIHHLKPLILKDVADEIEMHESTVSRVTNNKYIATPRGIFELNYFFTNAINNDPSHAELSSETIRTLIRKMIDQELPNGILSDDMIVENLEQEGIQIARRTVAKYRETLKIPSSIVRRRMKSLQAKLDSCI